MIFSELYSAYYNTVAAIISGIIDGEHSEKELQKIVLHVCPFPAHPREYDWGLAPL